MAKSKRVVQATSKKNKGNIIKRAKIIKKNHEVLAGLHNEE